MAEELGGLPLALEQAAAYMTKSGKPLADYLSLFHRRRAELLSRGEPTGYKRTVAATVQLAVDDLRDYPVARMLLTWCALMAADKIPLDVLATRQAVDVLPVEMRAVAEDEFALDDAIAVLYKSSLVTRDEGGIEVHRLVQEVVRDQLPEAEYQAWAEIAVRLLADAFPSALDELASPSHWPRCEQLIPHVYATAKRSQDAHVAGARTAELLMHLGSYLQHRGEYDEATTLFERALGLTEKAHGPDNLNVAHVLNALGYVRRARGDLSGALAAHEHALRIIDSTLPPDDVEVGSTLNSLGRVLYEQGDLTGARSNLERALRIVRANAPDQPEEASILNNMGCVFRAQGDLAAARAAHEQALAIKEGAPAFGPDHPSVAGTLASLGRVLFAQHELDAARLALSRARSIQESALGVHPDLAITLEGLIDVLDGLGNTDQARTTRERARAVSDALSARRPRHQLLID